MPETGIPSAGRVVCNTGPLVALVKIRHIKLLPMLFSEVLVPSEVVSELSSASRFLEAQEVLRTPGIVPLSLQNAPERMLSLELEAGEAAVIALALEQGIDHVIIDEKKARRIAGLAYHLKVLGTGGLLLRAKKAKLVQGVRPLLQEMRRNGYFLSERLVEALCRQAGE
jgi:uncharacterized protein